jgi:hypothetical protein
MVLVGIIALLAAAPACQAGAGDEFFEKEIRPILAEHCQRCHGDAKPKGGLRLTARARLLKGGDSGPAAVAGNTDESLLIKAVRYTDELRMPPKGKLPQRQIDALTRWVQSGLPWPEANATSVAAGGKFVITPEQKQFWSFQPIKPTLPPAVRDAAWAQSEVDRYVLAALETRGLRPAAPADRRTLVRRVTFDLTGLPPTPEEVEAFVNDPRPDAYPRLVDRLLASPAYGERWGRHWLDLARYTDSFDARITGTSEMDCGDAWRYRDWVVNAFNRDLPYNRFLTDQIAGDLVPGDEASQRDGIIATTFLTIGNWGGGDADKEKLLTDIADDQVDVVSRTFLGITLACARCHDHKFDPFSQADYYGLAGIFFSTHILANVGPKTNGPPMLRVALEGPTELARQRQHQKQLAAAEKQLKQTAENHYRAFVNQQQARTAEYLLAAEDYRSQASPGLAIEEFASRRGLHGFALRQWLEYLGRDDIYPLMTRPIRDVLGKAGVHGWRGEPECPSLLVNTTQAEVSLLTFTLPPHAVSVHPGPSNGVVVGWRSPMAGTVRIRGKVSDADAACGDGIAWAIDLRSAGLRRELAAGEIPNGGSQPFELGRGAPNLAAIAVRPGDRIELVVLPRANYVCDTTVVDLEIALADGSRIWNLAGDLVPDPHVGGQGNPHADRYGNPGVWSFMDMANSHRGTADANRPELAAWERAVAEARTGKTSRKVLEQAARSATKSLAFEKSRSPYWIKRPEDEAALSAEARMELRRLRQEIVSLRKTTFPPPEFANGAQEGGVPGSSHAGVHDVRIHIRGRYDRLGELVPRRFPEVLVADAPKAIQGGSGRLELARWLTRADNPLTARVMVNRIWQQHFGRGIVPTPSNFGKLGRPPTHPELLDYLAGEFIRSGWSIKHVHRLLLLSATYQQSSDAAPQTQKIDPDNNLLERMSRRRLEAESIRDSVLAVAGSLIRQSSGPAVRDFNAPRRTLYLMTIRSDRSGFGPLFDVADSTAPVEARTTSTVAPQALFLLNSPFILQQTRLLAQRIMAEGMDDRSRLTRAYALLYGRPPQVDEMQVGLEYLASAAATGRAWEEYCQVLLCANEFLYID